MTENTRPEASPGGDADAAADVPDVDDGATVVAVITAFRPGPGLLDLVGSLIPDARVIVVDDSGTAGGGAAAAAVSESVTGSDDTEGDVLAAAERAGALVIRHDRNRGIAAALNTGVAAARAQGDPRYVLTLDQDSTVDDGFVAGLRRTAEDAAAAGLAVGLVAPAEVQGLPSPATGRERGFLVGGTPIQSGMLIPMAALDRAGGFAEQLFIDGVDTDFALRLGRHGLRVLLAPRTRLGHSLGERYHPTLFGHPLVVGGAPLGLVAGRPFRYYYLLRNRVLLNRLHGRRHRAWSVRETLLDLRHLAIVLALVPGRRARARAAWAGLRDGWAGRSGRIPAGLESRLRRTRSL